MKTFGTALLALALTAATAFSSDAFFPRYPVLSPDGTTVVFSFQGDLWRVSSDGGTAVRLTAHPAYDAHPVFSPDGAKIAFSSDRYGDDDVFVIPAGGGTPQRLTYASTRDIPRAWSADGTSVLFTSRRLFDYPMGNQVWSVPAGGGTPERLADTFADEVAVSPDGSTYLLAVGRVKFGRRHYRGSYQRDLWLYTPGEDPLQLTTHRGYDTNPLFGPDGKTLYWISDADSSMTANLWRMNADGSNKAQVTHFVDSDVRSAGISSATGRIVLEDGTGLYLLDPSEGGEPRALTIEVADDQITNPVSVKQFSGEADEIEVSDDGEEFALVVHGDIVLVNVELGGRAAAPVPSPWRDNEVSWKPGGADTLLFVTDRYGARAICLLISDDPEESNLRLAKHHKIVRLTDGGEECFQAKWSPKGDRIAYIRGKGDLHVMDADGTNDRVLFNHWSTPEFSWSPDGRWIAFSREDRNYNSDIWIIPAEGGEAVNISQHPDDDMGPVWSADGRMIAWSTRRFSNQYDGYFLYLTRADDERTKEEWEIWEKTRDKKKKKNDEKSEEEEEEKKGEEAEEDTFRVRIDFEDIHLRGRRATNLPADEFVIGIHPKGDRIAFIGTVEGKRDLFSVNRFGEDLKAITTGGTKPEAAHLGPEGKKIYFLKGGRPAYVPLDGGSVETTSFKATLAIDKTKERLQVFDEGWRNLGEWFYDPNLHGADWPKVRETYRGWVERVSHDRDFADIMNLMLGELGASHMGYYPDRGNNGSAGPDGYLGLEFTPDYEGEGLRIARVLPHGPADKEASRLQPGDILLAVEGQPVSRSENLFRALEHRAGDPTLVRYRRDGEELELELVPVTWSGLRQLAYDLMVRSKRRTVEEATGGEVGYVHIQGMGWTEVELFERDLYAAADDKDALIIDVRNNGGGWTTDMLLTILTQPVHAYTIGRDGEIGYPQPRYPLYRWEKPIAVICNEGSYSNAEIFSHAIQTIGRGPLVGAETGGNVISTGGWTTLDGGWIRLPFRGWYVFGTRLDQEGVGAVPDYIVPLGPPEMIRHDDPQLDKAVELMKAAAEQWRASYNPTGD